MSGEERRLKLIVIAACLIVIFFILQYDFAKHKSWNPGVPGIFLYPVKSFYLILAMGDPMEGQATGKTLEKDIALAVSLKSQGFITRTRRACYYDERNR